MNMIAEMIGVGKNWDFSEEKYQDLRSLEQELASIGIDVFEKEMVGEQHEDVFYAVSRAIKRSEVIILLGGMGCGKENISKYIIAEGLSRKLVADTVSFRKLFRHYKLLKEPLPVDAKDWISVPEGSTVFANEVGLAVGCALSEGGQSILMLPERPEEMFPMFFQEVLPYLAGLREKKVYSGCVRFWNASAETVQERIPLPLEEPEMAAAVYRMPEYPDSCFLRVTSVADTAEEAEQRGKYFQQELLKKMEGLFYEIEGEPVSKRLVYDCKGKKLKLAVAESKTQQAISEILLAAKEPEVFEYPFVVESEEVKQKVLDVPIGQLAAPNMAAVMQMAKGVCDIDKVPVGIGAWNDLENRICYLAVYANDYVQTEELHWEQMELKKATELIQRNALYLALQMIENFPQPSEKAVPFSQQQEKTGFRRKMEKLFPLAVAKA